jgi:hypothetical protein
MAHGDFYFAINATFYHFTERWGPDSLIAYWQGIGRDYLAPLGRELAAGGPPAAAKHWAEYFAAEPGGDVEVSQPDGQTVAIDVRDCPALSWLRNSADAAVHPPPHPMYCGHCLHINTALAEGMGWTFELEGGGGACRQWFRAPDPSASLPSAQDAASEGGDA